MSGPSFFSEFLIVLIAATIVAVLFDRARLPSVLGFLLAGFIIGPQSFSLISNLETIHNLAELGVVLLMLTIGLEFSIDHLKGFKRIAIFGGLAQILLSIGLGLLFAFLYDWSLYQGFILGSVVALSSTALVLKFLIDRGELDTEHGRIAVSILIFQDLAILPLMIFTTTLGQSGELLVSSLGVAVLKTLFLLTVVFLFARFIFPVFIRQVALSRNREIFFLTSVVICLAIAWLSDFLGLSFAVGALIAGFMFANTDYKNQLIGDVVPFRHIFVSIFFVSMGMLFNAGFALDNLLLIVSVVGMVLFMNFVLMTALIICFGFSPRVALAAGIILSQIGEFSFLIIEAAQDGGGIDPFLYQLLLSTAFITLFLTPFLFALVPPILRLTENISFLGVPPGAWKQRKKRKTILENHIILCGYGQSGRDLAYTFQQEQVPFILVDMNSRRIKESRSKNIKAIYGDGANQEVMRRAGIHKAKSVIVSFSDPFGMLQTIRVVQNMNPDVLLIVRTRYERDVAKLYDLGADIVIIEESQASYELNRTMLKQLKIPQKRIDEHLERIQARKELLIENAILKRK